MIEISKIEEILPQTQCRQCGYHDCADYAKAIAVGEKHNRCPAGGPQVISRLSVLLGREDLPLSHGRYHRLSQAYALCGRRSVQRLLSLSARLSRRLHLHGTY